MPQKVVLFKWVELAVKVGNTRDGRPFKIEYQRLIAEFFQTFVIKKVIAVLFSTFCCTGIDDIIDSFAVFKKYQYRT